MHKKLLWRSFSGTLMRASIPQGSKDKHRWCVNRKGDYIENYVSFSFGKNRIIVWLRTFQPITRTFFSFIIYYTHFSQTQFCFSQAVGVRASLIISHQILIYTFAQIIGFTIPIKYDFNIQIRAP